MSVRRSFTAPVWWLLFMLIVDIFILSLGMISMKQLQQDDMNVEYYRSLVKAAIIIHALIIGAIIAECIVYWKLRRVEYNKMLAWAHVVGLLFALIILPFTPTVLGYLAEYYGIGESFMRSFEPVRVNVIRCFLLLGHVCFIVMLVERYRRQKKEKQVEVSIKASSDLLDDYAS